MKNNFRLFNGVNCLSVIGCIAIFGLFSFSSDKVIGREAYRLPAVDAGKQVSPSAEKPGNLAGARALSTITLSFINNAGGGFSVYLVNVVTGQDYILYSVNGANGYLYDLPEGVYSVYINPADPADWVWYTIGCNPEFETRGEVWMDEVTLDGTCNTIYAN